MLVVTRRTFRRAVLIVVAVAMLVGVLLMAERSGGPGGDRSQLLPLTPIVETQIVTPSGNPEKHCSDGKGRDSEYNPFCPQPSPG